MIVNEYVMCCAIWYHLYNLKNVKNTHGGVLLLVKLKVTLICGCFSRFLNCTNGTKSRNVFAKSTKAEKCTNVMFRLTHYCLNNSVEDLNL